MMRKIGLGFAAAFGLMATSFAIVPVEPAQAQNFFDQLFGRDRGYGDDEGYRYRRGGRDYWGRRNSYRWNRRYDYDEYDPESSIRVSAPKYYEYKPDTLKLISLAALAKVETASADETIVPIEKTPFVEARGHLSAMRIRALPEVGEAILAHYGKHPEFIWVTDGAVNDSARSAIEALGRAERFGLESDDYGVDLPDLAALADDAARQEALIRFEMGLSANVATYVLDAIRGRIDPNRISGYHDFKRKTVNLEAALGAVKASHDVAGYLETRHPGNAPFAALVKELADLRGKEDAEYVEIAAGTFIRPDATSPELSNVVKAIRLKGSDDLKLTHAETLAAYDGGDAYTENLVALVRDYQKEAGLKVDGIIGRGTIRSLTFVSARDKMDKVRLAMERLRWLPRDLGKRHVLINQPAFRATYTEEGKSPLSMKVVVGKKSNQTNFFMDKIETVEFNPYWGVPLSIIANEMLPKLSQNPYYLDDLGYEVTTLQGERISSARVNWYAVASKQSMINVRQPPGPKNALGELKILFPNKHSIYMHDTPQKELFQKDVRAFSHGCVRLENPRAMAAAVLGKSVDYIASRVAQGENESDPVKGDIFVYVAYFTAWPAPDGTVSYYDDMYERDVYLTRAIERTARTRRIES